MSIHTTNPGAGSKASAATEPGNITLFGWGDAPRNATSWFGTEKFAQHERQLATSANEMKHCPSCELQYPDKALNFCRVDGASLASRGFLEASPTAPFLALEKSPSIASIRSIAVLPFVNMTSEPENEHFCDGLTEELTHALAGIAQLRVAARTSAFSYKGKNKHVWEIGRTLNVAMVLEGSVRQSGNRVRITAQLINVKDGFHIWSERFDCELENIFAVQDQISLAIAATLEPKAKTQILTALGTAS